MAKEMTFEQVEHDILNAQMYAQHIAKEAIAECALWLESGGDDAETTMFLHGRYLGKLSALCWVLGYTTEFEYDVDSCMALRRYIESRADKLAKSREQ